MFVFLLAFSAAICATIVVSSIGFYFYELLYRSYWFYMDFGCVFKAFSYLSMAIYHFCFSSALHFTRFLPVQFSTLCFISSCYCSECFYFSFFHHSQPSTVTHAQAAAYVSSVRVLLSHGKCMCVKRFISLSIDVVFSLFFGIFLSH